MRDKVTRQCPQTTTCEERAEADSNRGPSAYQPKALPLGQTGSLSVVSKLIAFVELREDKFMLPWKVVIISCQAKNSVQSKLLDELQEDSLMFLERKKRRKKNIKKKILEYPSSWSLAKGYFTFFFFFLNSIQRKRGFHTWITSKGIKSACVRDSRSKNTQ